MPANSKAIAYEWHMTPIPEARIVKFRWEPNDGAIVSSMTFGTMYLLVRHDVTEPWDTSRSVDEMPWVVAQKLAQDQGFLIEEAILTPPSDPPLRAEPE